jgi:hypothetical protein
MNSKLIVAVLAVAALSSSTVGAQPFPGGRGHDNRSQGSCFPGERREDCGQRQRVEQRSNHHYVYRNGRYEDSSGAAIAGGILGFMLGAAIAGSNQDRDYYNTHRSDGGWRARCAKAYRSFDYSSGTYLGSDGYRHYCTR